MQDPYWADILRVLQVFWAREFAADHPARLKELSAELVAKIYRPYVNQRMKLPSKYRKEVADASVVPAENAG
jgi:thymidylate synthase